MNTKNTSEFNQMTRLNLRHDKIARKPLEL